MVASAEVAVLLRENDDRPVSYTHLDVYKRQVLVDCFGLYVTNLLLRQNEDMPINDRCQDVLGPVREFARVARTIPALSLIHI